MTHAKYWNLEKGTRIVYLGRKKHPHEPNHETTIGTITAVDKTSYAAQENAWVYDIQLEDGRKFERVFAAHFCGPIRSFKLEDEE